MSDDDEHVSKSRDIYGDQADEKESIRVRRGTINNEDDNIVVCEEEEENVDIDFALVPMDIRTRSPSSLEHVGAMPQTIMATINCLHRYAMDRIKSAERNEALWPPLLHVIFHYLYAS